MKPRRVRSARRRLYAAGVVALGVGIGAVSTILFRGSSAEGPASWPSNGASSDEYRPGTAVVEGEELVLAYVGSSRCSWSNLPELERAVRDLKRILSRRADSLGLAFAAVGVARDMSAAAGIAHLEKFGRFDEVMSGRGWLNVGVQKYVYGDMPGLGATPQVILLARSINFDAGHVGIANERVIARKVGADLITDWAQAGAPTQTPPQPTEKEEAETPSGAQSNP